MLPRSSAFSDAVRVMSPEDFDQFEPVTTARYEVIEVKAGEGVIIPGNMVHWVHTSKLQGAVAIKCNFLTSERMESQISTWAFEKENVTDSSLTFKNFEAIAMIWFFEQAVELRALDGPHAAARRWLLKKLLRQFEAIPRRPFWKGKMEEAKALLQENWIPPPPGVPPFEYCRIQQYLDSF